jgi:ATP-binding cassette subfamily B multidrug efflux pump
LEDILAMDTVTPKNHTLLERWVTRFAETAAREAAAQENITGFPQGTVQFIWHFLKPLKSPIVALVVIYTVAQLITLCEPIFIGQVVGAMVEDEFSYEKLGWLIGAYLVMVQLFARFCYIAGWKIESIFFPLLTNHIRLQLGDYIKRHSYRYFQDDFAGRLSGKVIEMPQAIMSTILDLTTAFLFTLLSLIFTFVLLFSLHWGFGLIASVYAVVFCYTIFVKSPHLTQLSQTVAKTRNVMRGHFIDSISNILLVKSFARERYEQQRLQRDLNTVSRQDQDENLVFWTLGRWQHLNNAWLQSLTILLAAYGWREGWFTVTDVATALPMVAVMASSAWWLLHVSGMFFTRLGEIREGIADLNKPIEIADKPGALPLSVSSPAIEFRDITFAYPGRPVFENFSLTIPAYQKVGFVGPSGAGKSTLAQLLMRFHDLQQGDILIDGQSVSAVTQTSLREEIAFIPQSSDLLHRTIRENISYGRLEASDEDIRHAAQLAHADQFIPGLQDKDGNRGYDSLVGERGVKLSGGQRQRIAIARAAMKTSKILLLDEATSALDSESERLIQESLLEMMKGRTVLVIAHRLSTIAHLDRLIIVDQGKIVEDGSHEELIAKGGLYARLWNLQSAGFLGDH